MVTVVNNAITLVRGDTVEIPVTIRLWILYVKTGLI